MDLTPYIDGLRRDLLATAAPGGTEVARAAELLTGSMDASARLCLLEALSDAAAEITTKLDSATVDVRLRGREADLTVTEITPAPAEPVTAPASTTTATDSGELTRITLRLPEGLKEQAERAASAEGISVNAWLVRAVAAALSFRPGMPPPPPPPPPPYPGSRSGRRVTGFAQA
jgi:predicted HicB family RNase H-like nuclease